jgi:hypothetical protein
MKQQLLLKFLVVVFVLYPNVASGQECSELLHRGIYDIQSSSVSLDTVSSWAQSFCDERFSSSESADNFGASIGVPIKGVPLKLGFDSSRESWSTWYSNFCSSVQSDESLRSRVKQYLQTINPRVVDAFNECISSTGLHVWLERTGNPKVFRFAAKFTTPTRNITEVQVDLDPSANVSCGQTTILVGTGETKRVRCTRTDMNGVDIIANARFAIVGGGNLLLPPIFRPKPMEIPNLACDALDIVPLDPTREVLVVCAVKRDTVKFYVDGRWVGESGKCYNIFGLDNNPPSEAMHAEYQIRRFVAPNRWEVIDTEPWKIYRQEIRLKRGEGVFVRPRMIQQSGGLCNPDPAKAVPNP